MASSNRWMVLDHSYLQNQNGCFWRWMGRLCTYRYDGELAGTLAGGAEHAANLCLCPLCPSLSLFRRGTSKPGLLFEGLGWQVVLNTQAIHVFIIHAIAYGVLSKHFRAGGVVRSTQWLDDTVVVVMIRISSKRCQGKDLMGKARWVEDSDAYIGTSWY